MLRDVASYPPTGQILEIAGKRVHAHVEGDGPDLILLHGASGNVRDFTFGLTGRLSERFRVIAFDRPGLGHSDPLHKKGESPAEQATILDAAAAELGVERAVLVGHSYGGAVAMAWALDHPQRVAAVVPVAAVTMPWPGDLGAWYRMASTEIGSATIVPLVAALTPRSFTHSSIETIFEPQDVPEGYLEHIGIDLTLRRATLRANVKQVGRLLPHVTEMAERYPSLRIPVEILHGEMDTIVPAIVHARRLARLLPDARLTELDGVGHMPHHAAPDATVAAIVRAVARAGLH